jgi:16S rRNA (cytidine1402-2'-O)-methyltransferase
MFPLMQIPTGSVPIERPCLYLVATPIGNLADITLRALSILAGSDLLLAEDTRVTRKLLDHYGIEGGVSALHDHNEREIAGRLVARIAHENLAVALVSDAGTPLVSDPGYALVQAALAAGIPVRAAPGASAVLAALCVSGLPSDRFSFEGFLPPKAQAARALLATLAEEPRTLIFFESPRRVGRTLALLREIMGAGRLVAVARELTKLHETVYRGPACEVAEAVAADSFGATGEFVIAVAPAPPREPDSAGIGALLKALAPHLPRSQAVEVTSACLGCPRNEAYRVALELDVDFARTGLG